MKFRVEVIWQDGEHNAASSIFLTSDGRVILQGRAVSPRNARRWRCPSRGEMISVDRNLIRAIKDMLEPYDARAAAPSPSHATGHVIPFENGGPA